MADQSAPVESPSIESSAPVESPSIESSAPAHPSPSAEPASTKEIPFEQLQEKLKEKFEAIMLEVLGGLTYDNDKAQGWRTTIMQRSSEEVKTASNMAYKFSLTVMVFEKTGYNRALSTVLTRKDGMVNAEYRGPAIYGLVDAVLIKL